MKKELFEFRKLKMILLWMFILELPNIAFIPSLFNQIEGALYYIWNSVITVVLVFCIWKFADMLPGVKKTGYFYKENGITVLEYENKIIHLNSVTELMISGRHSSSKGVNLLIRNNNKKIEFLSESLDKNCVLEKTTYYRMFSQILSENKGLKQEKDVQGNPIDYWYKV